MKDRRMLENQNNKKKENFFDVLPRALLLGREGNSGIELGLILVLGIRSFGCSAQAF